MKSNAASSGTGAGATSSHSGARHPVRPERRIIASTERSATARMLAEGFTPVAAGSLDPSMTNSPGWPCTSPYSSTTPVSGPSPSGTPPKACTVTVRRSSDHVGGLLMRAPNWRASSGPTRDCERCSFACHRVRHDSTAFPSSPSRSTPSEESRPMARTAKPRRRSVPRIRLHRARSRRPGMTESISSRSGIGTAPSWTWYQTDSRPSGTSSTVVVVMVGPVVMSPVSAASPVRRRSSAIVRKSPLPEKPCPSLRESPGRVRCTSRARSRSSVVAIAPAASTTFPARHRRSGASGSEGVEAWTS